ncbi:hypothetical protein GGX14DRAFT_445188 [Mycena pura]|uniref:Uncharacterized protein n=1 Tax=Mycena pura TaxID=153505 RepID=A0AAD6VHV1_9AGAR|nr:hypothetical protein GGX14DRAFT_445188 [Mycena pura]
MFFCLFILVHHLSVLFRWPGSCLAIIDLATSTVEIGVICLLIPLVLSVVFRAATIYNSEGRICCQHFEFLGGCALVNPAYTPWTIAFIWARLGKDSSASTKKGETGDVGTQPTSPTFDAVERGAYDDPQGTVSEKTPLLGVS